MEHFRFPKPLSAVVHISEDAIFAAELVRIRVERFAVLHVVVYAGQGLHVRELSDALPSVDRLLVQDAERLAGLVLHRLVGYDVVLAARAIVYAELGDGTGVPRFGRLAIFAIVRAGDHLVVDGLEGPRLLRRLKGNVVGLVARKGL